MSRPKDEGRAIQMEMWKLVGLLSDDNANIHLIKELRKGRVPADASLYRETMCGGLLSCDRKENPDLAMAGISVADPRFQVETTQKFGGFFADLSVYTPPATYLIEDKAMLFGIVQHELRHFMDFLDNGRRPVDTDYYLQGDYDIDLDRYSRNITEMRAHADQAASLLRIMGGADNAKKAIKQSHFGMAMVPEMTKAMMSFIDMLDEENAVKEFVEPPGVVVRSEDHEVRALVGHLQKMFEVMRLSNSIRPKKV